MKKFLEELSKSATRYVDVEVPTNTQAEMQYKELRAKLKGFVGRRALFMSKSDKESRVVIIEGVTNRFVVMSYKYYGMNYQGKITVSTTFGALICGDDRLDVE